MGVLGWVTLEKFITKFLVEMSPAFTLVVGQGAAAEESEVYVQAAKQDNGCILIEAVSDRFRKVPLSPDALNSLKELGWSEPSTDEDEELPNHFQVIEPEEIDYKAIAHHLTFVLQVVYQVNIHGWFTFGPIKLFRDLVSGKYGSEYAFHGSMSPAKRARRISCARFPYDFIDLTETNLQ
jgi:hypothetical protein